jgi:cell division protein FtsN
MTERLQPSARRRPHRSRRAAAGGTLIGIFIGLVLGLMLAAGVAYYFMRSGNPYQSAYSAPGKDAARDGGKAARPEAAAPDRAKADLYRVLPATEEPKAPPRPADRPAIEPPAVAPPAPAPVEHPAGKPGEKFWLQAGSFSTEADAEQLKAQLAFSGWEAVIQPATLPDKVVRYRVRLGPYDNTDELNRIKADLGKRGFEVAVIRN